MDLTLLNLKLKDTNLTIPNQFSLVEIMLMIMINDNDNIASAVASDKRGSRAPYSIKF